MVEVPHPFLAAAGLAEDTVLPCLSPFPHHIQLPGQLW